MAPTRKEKRNDTFVTDSWHPLRLHELRDHHLLERNRWRESLSQRYFFVSELKTLYPELRLIVHNDACHLHKFSAARQSHSLQAASIAPPAMKYAVDGFHATGHTDGWCLANCHPKNPDLVEELHDFRSSVCEFTFTWLSRYKHQTKHMSAFSFKFFLLEMIDAHNMRVRTGKTDHLPRARCSAKEPK